jgi:AcrR family transcriptional regulator
VARRAGNGALQPAHDAFDRASQHRQKRLALLHAAAQMFNERGYATASLETVATNLNISKAAVYYYFKNKQEILFECYQISFDIWAAALTAAQTDGGTGREKLEIYMRSYLETGLDTLQPLIVVREWASLEPDQRRKISQRRKLLRDQVRDIIAEGIADRSIVQCEPRVAVTIINAAISWLLRTYRSDGALSREAFIKQVTDLLLNGVRKRK